MTNAKKQPDALAELAKAAKNGQSDTEAKKLTEQADSKALPTDNDDKHDVARELLKEGAKGKKVDPKDVGEDDLPDRTRIGKSA